MKDSVQLLISSELRTLSQLNFGTLFLNNNNDSQLSHGRRRERSEQEGGEGTGGEGGGDGVLRVIVAMKCTTTLLGQPLPAHLPSHTWIRIVVATWLVFGVIFGTAYRGNLTAFLTIPKFPPRAETLNQLIQTSAKCVCVCVCSCSN